MIDLRYIKKERIKKEIMLLEIKGIIKNSIIHRLDNIISSGKERKAERNYNNIYIVK